MLQNGHKTMYQSIASADDSSRIRYWKCPVNIQCFLHRFAYRGYVSFYSILHHWIGIIDIKHFLLSNITFNIVDARLNVKQIFLYSPIHKSCTLSR